MSATFHPCHFGYALSGGKVRITSVSDTREVALKTGSYFYKQGIAWHEGLNVGDTAVSYLMIGPKLRQQARCMKFRKRRLAGAAGAPVECSISISRRDFTSGCSAA